MSVKVTFDIGHESTLRTKPTADGFTHDWELYVKGCDSNDISQFVDRVIFNLHESFPKPKRGKFSCYSFVLCIIFICFLIFTVVKEPPFILKESGYASFVLAIDIYFKNRDEPKKGTFKYDLVLQTTPYQNIQKEKFVFPNPSDEFRKKLLKGGGVIIHHNLNNVDEKSRDSNDERAQLLNKPKLGGSDHTKKHKRPDDNTFSNLFGPPIPKVTAKVSPDPRSKSSSSNSKVHQAVPNVQKPGSDKKSQHDKKTVVKEKVKQKHSSPHKEGKKTDEKQVREEKKVSHSKERDQSRDKGKKSPKHSPSSLKSSTQKVEMKHPTVSKEPKKSKKEKKEKSHDKEKDREKKDDKTKQLKVSSSKEIFKEKQKPNDKVLVVQNDLPIDSSKQVLPVDSIKKTDKHKHKKKDKNKKDESKDKDKKRDRSERSSSKSSVIYDEANDPRTNKPKETKIQQTPLDALMGEISERESSDSETENHVQKQEKIVETVNSYQALPADVIAKSVTHSKSEKPAKRSSKDKARSIEKEEKKRKRKTKDENEEKTSSSMDPPKKIYKKEEIYKQDVNSSTSLDSVKVSPIPDIIEKDLSIDYMSDLKDLQHKIMTLQSNTELQQVVEIIAATGRFEVTSKTFDFDLCALDKDTVQKLQTFFQPS